MRLSVTLLAASLLPLLARPARAQQPAPSTPTPGVAQPPLVTANGHGETRVAPDRATVMVAVETRAQTAAAASSQNATRQQAVLDALGRAGIQKDQLATVEYSVYPEQRYNEKEGPQVIGYVARSMLRVEVRKIDQVGRIIDVALGAGANNIGSVQFTSSVMDQARRTALTSAVAAACEDAAAMASAAGGALGRLYEVSSALEPMPPRPMFAMAERSATMGGDAAQTPINPGEFTVGANVVARWEFVAGGSAATRCR